MISELFLYFTTKVKPEAKTFGHLYEAIAIGKREKRCKKFWKRHREESKKLILQVSESIKDKKTLLILGSGPLHEIPIIELSKIFESITLVDIVHLRETKNKYKNLSNLNFVEHDITELESHIAKDKVMHNKIPLAFLNDNYSFVISANILSHLAYHLRDFLENKVKKKFTFEELNQFSNQISRDHYSYLKSFPCPVLLITDTETYLKDPLNKIIETQTPYLNFQFPRPVATWLWDVAPIPEYSPEISLQMKVAGFILNQ